MHSHPFPTVLKQYGRSLVELAGTRDDIVCFTGDLTRQCEIDLFQDEYPDRFIHTGMAEAHMMSMAGAMSRRGFIPFVHTFGVFATRRPLDQIINSIAYPNLPVRIVGFMPGISSPGGPSHQAIDDVALMRALPNMTIVDLADATEIRKAVPAIVDHPGPVYLRLKRGETPVIFEEDHQFSLERAQVVEEGSDVTILASGMMLSSALVAADILKHADLDAGVVNVPVIKPLDTDTVLEVIRATEAVVTVENHSIIGGLGSAVAEAMAESGIGRRLIRVGLQDTYAEGAASAPYLFRRYGLTTQTIIDSVWEALGRTDQSPTAPEMEAQEGSYAPV